MELIFSIFLFAKAFLAVFFIEFTIFLVLCFSRMKSGLFFSFLFFAEETIKISFVFVYQLLMQ